MRASQGLLVSLLLLSLAGLIHQACSSGSSPTEPAAPTSPAVNQSGSGDGTGSTQTVSGPGIDLEKSTNGFDADTPPGPSIPVSQAVEWTFVATNIGDVTLQQVLIEDDQLGEVCRERNVAPGARVECSVKARAVKGQYENIGKATATDGKKRVSDSDPSHYLGGGGAFVAVEVEKSTNGDDADFPTGPIVNVKNAVEWEYVVTNIGDVELTNWVVEDNQLGEICRGSNLAAGASDTCTAGPVRASAGQYVNVAEVTASDGNIRVSDDDPSHYFGSDPAVSIDKLTNGKDGPTLYVGCPVEWTYEVTNKGNIDLDNIVVTDSDRRVTVNCRTDTLPPRKSMTCKATSTVEPGGYRNTGTVKATAPVDNDLEASDGSGYVGVERPIDCADAYASPDLLWPPNHKMVGVNVLGVIDVCGKTTRITIDSIFQDEPLDSEGDGNTQPDASGVGTSTAKLRAERAGTLNGRVYHIDFTATDSRGEVCDGTVKVGVPHDNKETPSMTGACTTPPAGRSRSRRLPDGNPGPLDQGPFLLKHRLLLDRLTYGLVIQRSHDTGDPVTLLAGASRKIVTAGCRDHFSHHLTVDGPLEMVRHDVVVQVVNDRSYFDDTSQRQTSSRPLRPKAEL